MAKKKLIETKTVDKTILPSLTAECCLTCKFYFMPDGLCRRFPPHVIGAPNGKKQADGNPILAWLSIFPSMTPSGSCGEWKARNV